jgi:hypothetical protein
VIGLMCMPTKPEPLNLGVPVVNFPRANAILARAQALLWVRDWIHHKTGTFQYRISVSSRKRLWELHILTHLYAESFLVYKHVFHDESEYICSRDHIIIC